MSSIVNPNPRMWRSLEERDGASPAPSFIPSALQEPMERREFLQLMGASIALSGLSACTRMPQERIVPYVQAPEELARGEDLYFASGLLAGGSIQGVLVRSHQGRPIKIDGNP